MAKTKADNQADPDDESPRSFEQSLSELQDIVGALEDGSLGLEDSMARFEQGMALLRECYAVLQNAEQRIELLTGIDDEGTAHTESFDSTATIDKATQSKAANTRPDSAEAECDAGDDDGGHPARRLF